jgi:hypothetical protein
VAIDTERDPAFDKEQVLEDPLDALTICSSLLSVSNEKGPSSEEEEVLSLEEMEKTSKPTRRVVALAHYSVKEYLISDRIQGRAALYSLQCTTSNAFIVKCCLGYLLQFQRPDNFCNETIVVYKLARYSAQFWIVHSQAAKQNEEANRLIMKLFSLQAASANGHDEVVELLLGKGADVNAQGGHYGNALQAASANGHDKVVELLLSKSADSEQTDSVF